MTQTLSITALRHEDHDQWLKLWNGYLRFYETSLDEAMQAVTWSRLLDPQEPMGGFLAWGGAKAVGLVHWIQHRSAWTVGDYCYLQDLFVDPDQRGGGVGRKLIEQVYRTSHQTGCSRVYWLTHKTNSKAQQLYDRIATRSGFIQYRHLFDDQQGDA